MNEDKRQIWVCPKFAKKLKKSAVDEDMTTIDYTKKLSEMDGLFVGIKQDEKKKKMYEPIPRFKFGK